jgi:hypothetical protein
LPEGRSYECAAALKSPARIALSPFNSSRISRTSFATSEATLFLSASFVIVAADTGCFQPCWFWQIFFPSFGFRRALYVAWVCFAWFYFLLEPFFLYRVPYGTQSTPFESQAEMLVVHIPIERSVAGAIVLSSLSFVVELVDKAKGHLPSSVHTACTIQALIFNPLPRIKLWATSFQSCD